MNRFFVDKINISEKIIRILDKDDLRHIVQVLRMKKGEEVYISDGEGSAYIASVDLISKMVVELKIKERFKKINRDEQKIRIALACSVPKNAYFEDIVDKCTQLGVDEIIPLLTERTLIEKDVFDKKAERMTRVMLAAAKQSGVLFLPKLRAAVNFSDFIIRIQEYDFCVIPNLTQKSINLKDAFLNFTGKSILVFIGPEGDFTSAEVELVIRAGGRAVGLGESVLRVDTAAIAVVSYLRLLLE